MSHRTLSRPRRARSIFAVLATSALVLSGLAGTQPVAATAHPAISPATATVTATVTDGPDLVVEPSYSAVTVIPRGNNFADRIRENRWFRHSGLEPAGRYVTTGDVLTVSIPAGTTGMRVLVGQYGPHLGVNGGAATPFTTTQLTAASTTITATSDGVVSFVNLGDEPVRATVTGGDAVPTFTLGETTVAEFQADFTAYASSPFVVVQGRRVAAVFQRRIFDAIALAGVTDARVAFWDEVVDYTDFVYGLSVDATGLHRKSLARVFIANPDTGPGGASATNDRVTFQVSTGTGRRLLAWAEKDLWGLWHEIGHTYQTLQYRWAGTTEITVNISPLAFQASHGWPSALTGPGNAAAIDAFLALPEGDRVFDEAGAGAKLAMFDGLRTMFGDGFYPVLNRTYRQQVADGVLSLPDAEAMKQHFMVTAAHTAQYDLRAYFRHWGLEPSAATDAVLASYGTVVTPTPLPPDLAVPLDAARSAGGIVSGRR